MTPIIAFRVAHASWTAARRALLMQLRRRLGPVEPPHSFRVIQDTDRQGCWPTVRNSWIDGVRDPYATHVFAMQDDVHPCPNFVPALELLIGMRPEAPLALWTARAEFDRMPGAWVQASFGSSGGGVVMPKAMTAAFLRWNDRWLPESRDDLYPEDWRLAWYFLVSDITLYYTVPGLMNHYGTVSLLGHNAMNKKLLVRRFIGLDGDPLAVDWRAGFEDPPISRRGHVKKSLLLLSPAVILGSGLGRVYPTLGAHARRQGDGDAEAKSQRTGQG